MSNMVLEDLLAKEDIKVFRCGVGDTDMCSIPCVKKTAGLGENSRDT